MSFYFKLNLPPDMAIAIAMQNGDPPQDLHVTLAFMSKDDPTDLDLAAAVACGDRIKRACPAPFVRVTSLGYFPRRDVEQGVWWRAVESSPLEAMRDHLIRDLDAFGVKRDRTYARWTPHITVRRGRAMTLDELALLMPTEGRMSELVLRAGNRSVTWDLEL